MRLLLVSAVVVMVAILIGGFGPDGAAQAREFEVDQSEATIDVPPDEDPDPEYEVGNTLGGLSDHSIEVTRQDEGDNTFCYRFRSWNGCTGKAVNDTENPKQRILGGDWDEEDSESYDKPDLHNSSVLNTAGAFGFCAYVDFMENGVDEDWVNQADETHGFSVSNP